MFFGAINNVQYEQITIWYFYIKNVRFIVGGDQWFFLGGNFYFRGNRFSEFLGEMLLGEILGLAFLGEIALGKIFETRKFGGNEQEEMLTKYSPGNAHKIFP